MKGDALQTFKNINGPTRDNLGEILAFFRRKYVKPHSMATAKHKFQKLVFNLANQMLVDFLEEIQKLAKDAFGIAARTIIEQFVYAKIPPHLKKLMNQAHLENGSYEQFATYLEKELELNGLEAPDELQIITVSQNATNTNAAHILGALSRLGDFLMNPLIQGHSGTAPETSQNEYDTNQGMAKDNSLSDLLPKAGIFHKQTTRNSGPEDGHS